MHQNTGQILPLNAPQTPPDQFSNPSDSLSSNLTQSSSPRNSCETEAQYMMTRRKRPSSNYFRSSQNCTEQSHIRQQVQLKLIEEVNNQQYYYKNTDLEREQDNQVVPREGNIGLRSSLIDYNNSNSMTDTNHIYSIKKTRAQMIPKTETLAPVFKTQPLRQNSLVQPQDAPIVQTQSYDKSQYSSHPKLQLNRNKIELPDFYDRNNQSITASSASPRNSANSTLANELNEGAQILPQSITSNQVYFGVPKSGSMSKTPRNYDLHLEDQIHPDMLQFNNLVGERSFPRESQTPKAGKAPVVIEPRPMVQQVERQIKYLGLVIEKDEEYELQDDDIEMMRNQKENGCISRFSAKELQLYDNEKPDAVKRQYLPIRDRYIKIVKNSRKLSIESFEKRSRKDLKQTCRGLIKVAKQEKRQKFDDQIHKSMSHLSLE